MMMLQAQRMLPVLYQATRVTGEKLDGRFVREEFMRTNGHRQLHLLVPEIASQTHQNTHWHRLHSTYAWAESHRAYSAKYHTPLTQRFGDIGRMQDTIPNVKIVASAQQLVIEHTARQEGTFMFDVDLNEFRERFGDESSSTPTSDE
jgi:hypothetical protein